MPQAASSVIDGVLLLLLLQVTAAKPPAVFCARNELHWTCKLGIHAFASAAEERGQLSQRLTFLNQLSVATTIFPHISAADNRWQAVSGFAAVAIVELLFLRSPPRQHPQIAPRCGRRLHLAVLQLLQLWKQLAGRRRPSQQVADRVSVTPGELLLQGRARPASIIHKLQCSRAACLCGGVDNPVPPLGPS